MRRRRSSQIQQPNLDTELSERRNDQMRTLIILGLLVCQHETASGDCTAGGPCVCTGKIRETDVLPFDRQNVPL